MDILVAFSVIYRHGNAVSSDIFRDEIEFPPTAATIERWALHLRRMYMDLPNVVIRVTSFQKLAD